MALVLKLLDTISSSFFYSTFTSIFQWGQLQNAGLDYQSVLLVWRSAKTEGANLWIWRCKAQRDRAARNRSWNRDPALSRLAARAGPPRSTTRPLSPPSSPRHTIHPGQFIGSFSGYKLCPDALWQQELSRQTAFELLVCTGQLCTPWEAFQVVVTRKVLRKSREWSYDNTLTCQGLVKCWDLTKYSLNS